MSTNQKTVSFLIESRFNDAGINEYIENYFTGSKKNLIVIDPCQPDYDFSQYDVHSISKSICEVECQELIEIS